MKLNDTINFGRRLAYETFAATLMELRGRLGVTETLFRDIWLQHLRSIERLTWNGWYDPPPLGMAVLFATDERPARICYESLRLPQYAPGVTEIDWNRGMMYAYCSPLDRETGLAGDFAITLYFGREVGVREHFRRAFAATNSILQEVALSTRSAALLRRSETIFLEAGLQNTIASITDSVPLDLGHSIPFLPAQELIDTRVLSPAQQQQLRASRRFVSASKDWALSEEQQVTIEPQLVARKPANLPQVSFHYVVSTANSHPTVLRECDEILRQWDLAD